MPPCNCVAMFTRRGDTEPRTAPRCWVNMGLAHDGGFCGRVGTVHDTAESRWWWCELPGIGEQVLHSYCGID